MSVQNITLGVELPITVLNKSERDIDLSGMCLQLRACTRRSLFGVIPLPRYLWRRKVRAQRIGGVYLDGDGSCHSSLQTSLDIGMQDALVGLFLPKKHLSPAVGDNALNTH